MAQINVNIRMDAQLKNQFEMFCNTVGLTMSTAFNVFARTTVQRQKIPFEIAVETDDFYSKANMKALDESIRDAEAGRLTPHELIEVG
jgi:DNA-damage-inducible protein J